MLIIRLNVIFLASFFTLLVGLSYAQSDSLRVAQLLDSTGRIPDKKDYFFGQIAEIERRNKKNLPTLASIWLLQAKYEIRTGNLQSANEFIKKGKSTFENNTRYQAHFFNLEGTFYAVQKQFDSSIQSFQVALRKYDAAGMKKEAAFVKNNIANIFFNLNDFESAYPYAKASFDEVYALKDTIYYPQIAAVLAISETKLNKVQSAEKHANLAVSAGNKYKVPVAVILGKYALGDISSHKKEWQKANDYYSEVVEMSADLRLLQFEVYGRIGLLSTNVSLEEYEKAIFEGEKVIEINNLLNVHYVDYTVYQQLSEAYSVLGKHEKAFEHLKKANTMYREYSSVENKKTIQELLTKYEAEKKDRALSQKELELSRAIIWVLALVFLLFMLTVFILWWRKRSARKLVELKLNAQRKQLEAFVEGEQRERERIAADIHDGIASTLTGLSLQMQQAKSAEEVEELVNHLEVVRNEVRLVSKNILPFNLKQEGWIVAFQRFVSSMQTPDFSIFLLTDFDEKQLNNQRGMVVYRVLQELVQNTIKHAGATECELLITEEKEVILIQFSDNGKGVSLEELEKGNGWQSVKTRLAAIDGKIVFPLNPFDGFKIDILLPKH